MLRLAARVPRLRAPVTSTLGVALNTGRMHHVAWSQQPSGASLPLGKPSVMAPAQQATSARSGDHQVAVKCGESQCKRAGKPYLKTPPLGVATHSEVQSHGRAALGGPGSLRQRRASGAGHHHRNNSTAKASAGLRCISSIGHRRNSRCLQAAPPNRSFKGTRNSKAARPRSAQAYHAPHGRAPLPLRAP